MPETLKDLRRIARSRVTMEKTSDSLGRLYKGVFTHTGQTKGKHQKALLPRQVGAGALLCVGNLLTGGLINVGLLLNCKSGLEKQEFVNLMGNRIATLAKMAQPRYGIDEGDLRAYLRYRLGIQKVKPDVRPITSTAFAFGWQRFLRDHAEQLRAWGIED